MNKKEVDNLKGGVRDVNKERLLSSKKLTKMFPNLFEKNQVFTKSEEEIKKIMDLMSEEDRELAEDEYRKGRAAKDSLNVLSAELIEQSIKYKEFLKNIKESGFLVETFESKTIHKFKLLPFTKEQAFEFYKEKCNPVYIFPGLEKSMPYNIPALKHLDVLIISPKEKISSKDIIEKMDKLGLRPMTYEEMLQFTALNSGYQKKSSLVALGSRYESAYQGNNYYEVAYANYNDEKYCLISTSWDREWFGDFRFLFVRK